MPRSFAPVVGRAPKVLILGSMPGVASLRLGRYYGHPRNAFWRLLGAALGEDLEGLGYGARLARLKARGVALWDVLASCEREGSLDADIRGGVPNDVAGLLRRTGIRAVFCNGTAAYALLRRRLAATLPAGVTVARLPSSSPANASVPAAAKRRRWAAIGEALAAGRPR